MHRQATTRLQEAKPHQEEMVQQTIEVKEVVHEVNIKEEYLTSLIK